MQELKVIENELVPVYETSTGEKVVYGSELHAVLKVKSRFNDWIRNRLNDCEAAENEDYESFTKNLVSGGQSKEYLIKLDIAKEMAMLERNEKGKQVRRYFIQVEKKYKEKLKPKVPQTYLEALKELVAVFGLNCKKVAA
jgi:phage anti-repressor protein